MSTGSVVAAGKGVLDSLLASLAPAPHGLMPAQPQWLTALRGQALDRVGALTLPSTHDEAWRFTNISALTRQSFQPVRTPAAALHPHDIGSWHLEEAPTRLVFVEGVHAPQLSCVGAESGLIVSTLSSSLATQDGVIGQHLGQHAPFHDALFSALNTALVYDAAVLIVPRDIELAAPVHVLFISTQPDVAAHPRLLLVAGAGSALTLIEEYAALHHGAYFTNAVAEVVLGANARVEHVRVQRESQQAFHIASCAVSLGAASRYHSVSIALGAQISRLNLSVLQSAAGAQCALDGLALIGNEQLADTHTFIDHAKSHGVSRQLHKCIVDGGAHAVFNGKVTVRPGAVKTDSAQSSRNLLLTGKALVDTQPQLQIFADDVKCTHGATVGQLDSEEVFYLQSRGLSEVAARSLLTYAFGAEVINRIPVASLLRQLEQAVIAQTQGRA